MLSGPSPLYEARKQLFTSLVSPGLAVRALYWSTSLVYGPWLVTSLVTRLVCRPVCRQAARAMCLDSDSESGSNPRLRLEPALGEPRLAARGRRQEERRRRASSVEGLARPRPEAERRWAVRCIMRPLVMCWSSGEPARPRLRVRCVLRRL